ncbi:hypothetical protein DFH09DRAFT_1092294 [Mycena vulgaris]|nr:hypothetical protein DFH09DRAFT_1092294 [Mycena vulgaris]
MPRENFVSFLENAWETGHWLTTHYVQASKIQRLARVARGIQNSIGGNRWRRIDSGGQGQAGSLTKLQAAATHANTDALGHNPIPPLHRGQQFRNINHLDLRLKRARNRQQTGPNAKRRTARSIYGNFLNGRRVRKGYNVKVFFNGPKKLVSITAAVLSPAAQITSRGSKVSLQLKRSTKLTRREKPFSFFWKHTLDQHDREGNQEMCRECKSNHLETEKLPNVMHSEGARRFVPQDRSSGWNAKDAIPVKIGKEIEIDARCDEDQTRPARQDSQPRSGGVQAPVLRNGRLRASLKGIESARKCIQKSATYSGLTRWQKPFGTKKRKKSAESRFTST